MTELSRDLHVAYDQLVPGGAEMEFRAERLSEPAAHHWVLCVSTDQVSCELTRVIPTAVGHSLDTNGVLGFIFPSSVKSVQLTVKTPAVGGAQQWRFWLDEGIGAE